MCYLPRSLVFRIAQSIVVIVECWDQIAAPSENGGDILLFFRCYGDIQLLFEKQNVPKQNVPVPLVVIEYLRCQACEIRRAGERHRDLHFVFEGL